MPFWIEPDFQRAVYMDCLTISITFPEYLGILPSIERYSKNSPGKDAALFAVRVLLRVSYNFVQISGRRSSQALVQIKTASPEEWVCFYLTLIINCLSL